MWKAAGGEASVDADTDWRENRILWRARGRIKLGQDCVQFTDLAERTRGALLAIEAVQGRPILFFGSLDEPWTLLTTERVLSRHRGHVEWCRLDDIRDGFTIGPGTKLTATTVSLDRCAVVVWAPAGRALYGLIGILMMFPLNRLP